MQKPLINILTRTSNRPNGFDITYNSVLNQTYKNVRHIVSYDNDEDLDYIGEYGGLDLIKIDKNKLIREDNSPNPKTGKYSPHNLYFNEMIKMVDEGWVIYLDDDDRFVDDYCLEKIVNVINESDEDTLVFWQFKLGSNLILPPIIDDNNPPQLYKIGGGSVSFNVKQKKYAKWDAWKCSDYRVLKNLYQNVNNVKFINEVLILAPKPGSGNKVDIYI